MKASRVPKKTKPIKKQKAKLPPPSSAKKEKDAAKSKTQKKLLSKEPTQDEPTQVKPSKSGYVFFKNPKYMKLAEKLSKMNVEDIHSLLESNPLNLQEKIHVGNLLSGLSAKICQHGVISENYCYGINDEKYKKTYQNLMETWTANKLKEVLVLNEHPKTAPKNVLCERVADGMILGRIPKCPNCLGGRFEWRVEGIKKYLF